MTESKGLSHRSRIILAVAIVAIIVVGLVISILLASPFTPKHSATVKLKVLGTSGLGKGVSYDFSVYVDGRHVTDGTITGNEWGGGVTNMNITVGWKGNDTHRCTFELFFEGSRSALDVWVADGLTSSLLFAVRL